MRHISSIEAHKVYQISKHIVFSKYSKSYYRPYLKLRSEILEGRLEILEGSLEKREGRSESWKGDLLNCYLISINCMPTTFLPMMMV